MADDLSLAFDYYTQERRRETRAVSAIGLAASLAYNPTHRWVSAVSAAAAWALQAAANNRLFDANQFRHMERLLDLLDEQLRDHTRVVLVHVLRLLYKIRDERLAETDDKRLRLIDNIEARIGPLAVRRPLGYEPKPHNTRLATDFFATRYPDPEHNFFLTLLMLCPVREWLFEYDTAFT